MTGRAKLETGRPALRFERRLGHSPAKVWRAITDPAELAHWLTLDTVEAGQQPESGPVRPTAS